MLINDKKGFTLIEMLVVIAVIAILVSILVPTVSVNVAKAKAATDASNLRNVLGQVNTFLIDGSKFDATTAVQLQTTESVNFPGAKTYVLYCDTHFVETFYVINGKYYSLDYFVEVAEHGESEATTEKPVPPAGSYMVYEWFEAGVGAITP